MNQIQAGARPLSPSHFPSCPPCPAPLLHHPPSLGISFSLLFSTLRLIPFAPFFSAHLSSLLFSALSSLLLTSPSAPLLSTSLLITISLFPNQSVSKTNLNTITIMPHQSGDKNTETYTENMKIHLSVLISNGSQGVAKETAMRDSQERHPSRQIIKTGSLGC